MKPLPFLVVSALLAFALAPQARAEPQSIAVVDMVDLITKHPRTTELQKKLQQRQKEAQDYQDKENDELRKLKRDIDLMNPNNPARATKEHEFLLRTTVLKFELDWRKEQALREYMQGLESLYVEIQSLVAKYAREHQISLVLLKTSGALEAQDFNDYAAKVQLRSVVANDTSMDITEQIRALFMPRAPQPSGAPPTAPTGNSR